MSLVLIADDDPHQLELRSLIIQRDGHTVLPAASAAQAVSLLREEPSLLIMDLRLPTAQDGLGLLRTARAMPHPPKIVVLTGWPQDMENCEERMLADEVLTKPVRSQTLMDWVAKLALLVFLLTPGLHAAAFPFQLDAAAEVIAEIELTAAGAEWGLKGRESAMAVVTLDGSRTQHVMAYMGRVRHRYTVFLGTVDAGTHELKVERHTDYSASGIPLEVHHASFHQYQAKDPDYAVLANAPILHARRNTIGKFTDIPLVTYCERLDDGSLQYSVIFSNEDGGTPTRALMARWGRVTDIEHVYRVWFDKSGRPARAILQTQGHRDMEFLGKREAMHPVIGVSTDNNMVAGDMVTPVRYQQAPVLVDLKRASREQVMDDHPFIYGISARELEREGKLRKFGVVEGNKISAPENYLTIEMRILNKESRLGVLVRLQDDNFFRSSALGAHELTIERSGWVRTAVELPPATQPAQVAEIALQCLPETKTEGAGQCRVESIGKMFFLNARQTPDANFYRPRQDRGPWIVPAGQTRVISLR